MTELLNLELKDGGQSSSKHSSVPVSVRFPADVFYFEFHLPTFLKTQRRNTHFLCSGVQELPNFPSGSLTANAGSKFV